MAKKRKQIRLDDAILDALGFPPPVYEYKFAKEAIGRFWRFDVAWPDEKLYVEFEGGIWVKGRHVRPEGYMGDMIKYSWAAVLGWRGIRVPTHKWQEVYQWLDKVRQYGD